jgi:hypothetical protein
MSVEFKKFNTAFETANPGDPAYTETGDNAAASIEVYNNGEDADEDVLRRPVEQLRRRTAHIGEEANLTQEYMKAFEGRFIDMGSTTVKWEGISTGVFELSGAIKVVHPMYPDTVYELGSAVIGNAGVGFFNTAANRLKEEGDSLWITFGANGDNTYGVDLNARVASGTTALSIVQSNLRKAPTWVLIRDTVNNLGSLGIVPGSDVVQIYPDPINFPASFISRTVKGIFEDEDGYWYLEVSYDTPLWDQTLPGDEVPPVVNTDKWTRASLGAQYKVLDVTLATTRLALSSFSDYASNLHWFRRGRIRPVTLHGAPTEHREMEWLMAMPLCIVRNNRLHFPLANVAGIAVDATNYQSMSGFIRTSVADSVYAQHLWRNKQTFIQAAGGNLTSKTTTSDPSSPGRAEIIEKLEEAHADGNVSTPVFWLSPARPGRLSLYGNADGGAQPILKIAEQGFYTAAGADQIGETTLELRMPGTIGSPTLHGSRFSKLQASQALYTMKASNLTPHSREATADFDSTTLLALAGPGGKGLPIGSAISLGTTNLYETLLGMHDLLISGSLSFRGIYPCFFDLTAGNPAGAISNENTTQAVEFQAFLRLEQGTVGTPNTPFVQNIAVLPERPIVRTKVRNTIAANDPTGVALFSETTTAWNDTLCAITADGGPPTENTSYPASPDSGGIELFRGLFSTDLYSYTGAGPWTPAHTPNHSEVLVKLMCYPLYDGGTTSHTVEFYLQFEFHTEEGDATHADRLKKHMYVLEFKNAGVASAAFGVDPKLTVSLGIEHRKVWA